jgi:hypothetical protein
MACKYRTRLDVIVERRAACKKCDHSNGDTCELVESKHPGQSSIRRGTTKMHLACPIGTWPAEKTRCRQCRRMAFVSSDMVCFWCENKARLKAQ